MASPLNRSLVASAIYFALAGATVEFTRFQNGFAAVWVASAVLTATLCSVPKREWPLMLGCCAVASFLVTGLFGLGWRLAGPLAIANILEAAVAAKLIRSRIAPATLDSLEWFARFVLKTGVLAPGLGATIATACLVITKGHASLLPAWSTWFIGHALGGLTITPLAMLVARGEAGRWARSLRDGRWKEPAILYALFFGVTAFTFCQDRWPLLFLPFGPLMLICFRHDRSLAALAIATLALIGGVLTTMSRGPIALATADAATQAQFYQFYLACVVLTVLPATADLRSRQHLIKAIKRSDDRFRVILEHTADMLLHMSPDGRILYASPSVERLTGRASREIEGLKAIELVDEEWREHVARHHSEVLAARGGTVRYEYMATTGKAETRWFETVSTAICDPSGNVETVISMVRDIDTRKNEEFDLVVEANHDALTGLVNRRCFERHFNSKAGSGALCLALVDIDFFKKINDTYGHGAGDCALQTFADVAKRTVRREDLVARIGGEEFAILFDDQSVTGVLSICERLRREVAESITFYGDRQIQFTISVGVTPANSPDLNHILERADIALYQAKQEGRDRLRLAA